MDRLEELENIISLFSSLIDETDSKDLKELLYEQQSVYTEEKEELEEDLKKEADEIESGMWADWNNMRL